MSPRPLALLVIALALCACTTPATPLPTGSCDAGAVQAYTGLAATPEVLEAARKAAGADVVRALAPGQAVTMEYRDGRLNVHVDAGNLILRATCG